ncbi:protein FAM149B1-like isoform X5 [Hemiscyllium ocellatum]|uniref:protein FAM149B1-like isoform X5 n=1 Tax=Hemiscyllium ocellatum TaxID=170820 RepID=UPI002966446C|nr:protein FAM149B1-like isoform X5 [Hemiscyllium ocellatum]
MIQRYSRRLLSTPPEIQNLLHRSVENHPLPDKLEEFSTPSPITSVEDVDSTCSCESEISDDTSNQPSQDDFGHHWSAANSYTGTRISTACSSTFSWGDNEFENTTSQQVQQMLCEIDELLFEDKTCSHVQKLEKECQEWKWRFPHFRILGKQIVPPADEAYCWYPGPENVATPLPTFSSSSEGDVTELCVLGKKMNISDLSQCKDGDFMQKIATFPGEEHEEAENGVIVAEGIVEEYLAVDRRELEDENYEKRLAPILQSESRLGLPLVSLSHCRKNIIVAELFNEVWLEFLGCMEELIRKHWEGHVSDEEKSTASDESAGIEQTNLFLPLEPQLSQVRVPALTSYLTKSQRFDSTEWLAMQLQKTFKSQPRWCGSGVTYRTDEVQQAYSGAVQSRPSSLQIQGIPFHQRSTSLSGKIQQTASDRLSASTLPLRHNALLPPIGSVDIDHSAGKLTARPQKIRMYSNRAHSAVIDETSHLPPKDRLLGHEYFTRPKTSHTFRSDISYHRSFTALEYAHHAHTDRRFAGPDSNSAGLTELNLNSSSSSHLEILQHHSHSGSVIEAEEKVEEQTSLGHRLPLPIPPLIRGGIGSRSRTAL